MVVVPAVIVTRVCVILAVVVMRTEFTLLSIDRLCVKRIILIVLCIPVNQLDGLKFATSKQVNLMVSV